MKFSLLICTFANMITENRVMNMIKNPSDRVIGFFDKIQADKVRKKEELLEKEKRTFTVQTDSTPDEALGQIEERGYARPFAGDRRKIFRIGVNFSTSARRIDGWKVVQAK